MGKGEDWFGRWVIVATWFMVYPVFSSLLLIFFISSAFQIRERVGGKRGRLVEEDS